MILLEVQRSCEHRRVSHAAFAPHLPRSSTDKKRAFGEPLRILAQGCANRGTAGKATLAPSVLSRDSGGRLNGEFVAASPIAQLAPVLLRACLRADISIDRRGLEHPQKSVLFRRRRV